MEYFLSYFFDFEGFKYWNLYFNQALFFDLMYSREFFFTLFSFVDFYWNNLYCFNVIIINYPE